MKDTPQHAGEAPQDDTMEFPFEDIMHLHAEEHAHAERREGVLLQFADPAPQPLVEAAARPADPAPALVRFADDEKLPAGIKAKHAVLADGASCHAYFNFSAERREFAYGREQGRDLLTGVAVEPGRRVVLGPWDCLIVRAER